MNSVKLKWLNISLVGVLPFLLIVCFTYSCAEKQETKRIPIIYSSDLFNPPADPDDHYDLATLFMMQEFDVKAFIFDVSNHTRIADEFSRTPDEFGRVPLEQIAAITGRPIPPYSIGLNQPLNSPDGQAKEQVAQFQGGVDLILKSLRESDEKVLMFLVGSCTDFAAAYNRDPELLRQKVSAMYISAGNGPSGKQDECNAGLDPNAYICLLKSRLPIYWCPCIPNGPYRQATKEDVLAKNDNTYNTCFTIPNQAECLKNVSARLHNFFHYAFTASKEDPIPYLNRTPEELTTKEKWIWSTPAFFHAAGRKIYAGLNGGYFACSPQVAQKLGISDKEVEVYAFAPIQLSQTELEAQEHIIQGNLNVKESTVKVFQYIHPDYNEIMESALSNILGTY
ncbi:hypothetical protein FACS1894199_15820 [Bacteroidia bacterium]|nr:hypothetical protein FACS1894199_15820 [Bacteroidia bacterium]